MPYPGEEVDVVEEFEAHINIAKEIFREKYRSRGGSNITAQGFPGVFNRINYDKLVRLKQISDNLTVIRISRDIKQADIKEIMQRHSISEEDAIDDLYDIANYAIILIMLIQDTWG